MERAVNFTYPSYTDKTLATRLVTYPVVPGLAKTRVLLKKKQPTCFFFLVLWAFLGFIGLFWVLLIFFIYFVMFHDKA